MEIMIKIPNLGISTLSVLSHAGLKMKLSSCWVRWAVYYEFVFTTFVYECSFGIEITYNVNVKKNL